MGVFEYRGLFSNGSVVTDRVLFGKEVSGLSCMGALGYGWLKIRRIYEAWVFGVGRWW
ncbi:hypothetical protein HYC85_011964 [Camellia sinensis]|uniref:Uncharacterized protein n=1 Tax=Camellia sinensis TaxID=4442 RepID=A0A7J7HCK3_CAMSI|nr:hypothetical protein HYC85_011964 [Camellia sinensis]